MGKYSLIPSLVETTDKRGQQYELGRAGANTSKSGAFAEGFMRAEAQTTQTRTAQLSAQERFNPTRLAQDSLKRDVNNRLLQEQLEEAAENNRILRETGLEKAEESINEQRARIRASNASTAKVNETIRISKANGLEAARAHTNYTTAQANKLAEATRVSRATSIPLARASIGATEASTREAHANAYQTEVTAALDEQFGGTTRVSEAIERTAKAYKNINPANAQQSGDSGRAPNPFRDTQQEPVVQQDGFSQVPSINEPETPTTKSSLENAITEYTNNDMLGKDLAKKRDVSRSASARQLANKRIQTDDATNTVANG